MTKRKTHIATCASYGITGKRVGTHFFYAEDDIPKYEAMLFRTFGRRMPLYLRRRATPVGEEGQSK